MKRNVSILIAMGLACAIIINAPGIAAQETASNTGDLEKPLFSFSLYGEAIWAPFMYKAGNTDIHESDGKDAGMGVGGGGLYNGTGAVAGLLMSGSDPAETIGVELGIKSLMGNGFYNVILDNTYLWFRPFDMLKAQFGLYNWNHLQGRVKGSDLPVGGYGSKENDIFQPVESSMFGALFILTPPTSAPDALKGLMLFSSFGVSGWLDSGSRDYAARSKQFWQFIFSTPHAGIAYEHESFGLARLQFIGSTYKWGQGADWSPIQTPTNVFIVFNQSHGWFPKRSREAAQMELAANITRIPNVNLDIGFGIPFPVTVAARDNSTSERGILLGPSYLELGSRVRTSWADTNYLAEMVGDKWMPPVRITLGLNYRSDILDFGVNFRSKLEFGETVTFADGSPDYKGSLRLQFGFEPWYMVGNTGIISLDLSMLLKQNDNFSGKIGGDDIYNVVNAYSINHNGIIDLGLGAFFTKRFFRNSFVKTGICVNLPVGGDRYNWSNEFVTDTGGERLNSEFAEAYKKTRIILAIPIMAKIYF